MLECNCMLALCFAAASTMPAKCSVANVVLLSLALTRLTACSAMQRRPSTIKTSSPVVCRKVRFVTFNASLNRNKAGQLLQELQSKQSAQAANISHILQLLRPDVLLLNEFDYVADGAAVQAFQDNYLVVPQSAGLAPLRYEHVFVAPVNTGVPSGCDFDHDGRSEGPQDCFGYGFHPGQYGMALLSHFPIDLDAARTFQHFLWKDMPGALLPTDPHTQQPWYSQADLQVFRLSSKSHWDVPVDIPVESSPPPSAAEPLSPGTRQVLQQRGASPGQEGVGAQTAGQGHRAELATVRQGPANSWQDSITIRPSDQGPGLQQGQPGELEVRSKRIHLLLHHPTPPAFDGPEMRNMMRNHDEIRLWADYVGCGVCTEAASSAGAAYVYDDQGHTGGIATGGSFVIMGDHNADPYDGNSYPGAIQQLLTCCQINSSFVPTSEGGREAGNKHRGDKTPPETKTSSFDLRVDYVLPSSDMPILGGGVWWPLKSNVQSQLLEASDHRPVFLDVSVCR